jgi:Bifunctional DNA primase/polymerase, N-terminal
MSVLDEVNPDVRIYLRYLAAGMAIFPVNARGAPMTAHGVKDASSDPVVIEAWLQRWPHCEFGWALPADMVVVDLDEKHGKHGLRDFREREGCDPHDVMTPRASTPSGGMHIVFKASKPYKNLAPAIPGTGVDTRTAGGYVVLPQDDNGREWRKPLIGMDGVMAPLAVAPAWLDCAQRKEPRPSLSQPRAPLILAPRSAIAPASADPWAQRKALAQLERACAKVLTAPCGAQDSTRHAQCYLIGGLIARGDLGYEEAYAALIEAALAMPVYRDPWRNLEERTARSIESGMNAPLPLPANEQWVRDFRARMQARLTQMKEARARG